MIGRKRRCNRDECRVGIGDEIQQVEVKELAQARTADARFAEAGHDGNAHPQSIETGRMAVVGERVESEVDVVVGAQILGARTISGEGQMLRLDAVCRKPRQQSIAVTARRLHDLDRSAWWMLLPLIPLVGSIIIFIWYCSTGTIGGNRFGPDPLADIFRAHLGGGMPVREQTEQLAKIKGLLDSGAITLAEFNRMKSEILAS